MSATKTPLRSLESRERDYPYDDAIENYKSRVSQTAKIDLPKVDITKRRELFEQGQAQPQSDESPNISSAATKLGTEIVSIKDRISSLHSNLLTSGIASNNTAPKKVDLTVSTTLKDRLSSLHQQVSSPVEETAKKILDTPFKNVVETRNEFEVKQQQSEQLIETIPDVIQHESLKEEDVDEESSVSYSETDPIESVMVVELSENTTNIENSELTSPNKKSSNIAMFNFIHSNYRSFDDHENSQESEMAIEFGGHQMKGNELEKSNSVDTALSLCSSSDGTSLMDE